jgi:hypothetical protein
LEAKGRFCKVIKWIFALTQEAMHLNESKLVVAWKATPFILKWCTVHQHNDKTSIAEPSCLRGDALNELLLPSEPADAGVAGNVLRCANVLGAPKKPGKESDACTTEFIPAHQDVEVERPCREVVWRPLSIGKMVTMMMMAWHQKTPPMHMPLRPRRAGQQLDA